MPWFLKRHSCMLSWHLVVRPLIHGSCVSSPVWYAATPIPFRTGMDPDNHLSTAVTLSY